MTQNTPHTRHSRETGTRQDARETPREAPGGKHVDLAMCDEPTFMTHLEKALVRAAGGRPGSLMQIDVSRAHDIRETYGTQALDAVRTLVKDIACEQLGPHVPAFLCQECALSLLLTDMSPEKVAVRAREILTSIDDRIFHWKGHPFRLGAHIALVELGEPTIPAHGWLVLAREACKAAEELGGSGIRSIARGAQAWQDLERDRAWHDHLAEII